MSDIGTRITRRGGRILGRPGVYHDPFPHDFVPSQQYGHGPVGVTLCGRTKGIVYAADMLARLFSEDRLCSFCARRAG